MKAFCIKHKLTFSAIVTAVQFLLVFFAISYFFNIDDYHAELSLSGDYLGMYAEQYPFINALFARFLILLYRVCGAVPWYSVFDLLFLFCSFTAIHYSLITVLSAKRIPLPLIEGVYAVVFSVALLPNLSNICFTQIAGYLAIAGISLLFTKLSETGKSRAPRIASIIFMILSFLLRSQSCLVGLCFYLLTLFVIDQVTKESSEEGFKGILKGAVSSVIVMVILATSLSGLAISNSLLRNTSDGQTVLKWNSVRSKYFDYYDVENYENDADFFDSIGYDKDFFELSVHGWFVDDKCDYDHLLKISQYMDKTAPAKTVKSVARNLVDGIVENIDNRRMVPLLMSCFILFLGGMILIFLNKPGNKYWWLFYFIAVVFGTVILCLYLSFVGRFLYHVFRLCVYPAFFCLLFGCIAFIPLKKEQENKLNKVFSDIIMVSAILFPLLILFIVKVFINYTIVFYSCIILLSILLLLCLWFGVSFSFKKPLTLIIPVLVALFLSSASNISVYQIAYNTLDYDKDQPAYKTVTEYLKTHHDSVYISDFWSKTDIKNCITDSKSMQNCFFSYNYMQFSEAYNNKLLLNGKNSISTESLLDDDVYYIDSDTEGANTRRLLKEHLSYKCGKPVSVEVVESLDNGVKVYKFVCAD